MSRIAAPENDHAESLRLVRLMTFLSPAFPIGAFAFSHGLEAAIAEGWVTDRASLAEWVETLLLYGSGWNDLVLFKESFEAARTCDAERLADVAGLAAALGGSLERRAETLALGTAFAVAALPWSDAPPERLAYPVAVARLAAGMEIALGDGLAAFAHGFAANLVSVATRLVPLGQSEAMKTLHALEPVVVTAAAKAVTSTLDDLGSCALNSEIAAMRHETLTTRLFRS